MVRISEGGGAAPDPGEDSMKIDVLERRMLKDQHLLEKIKKKGKHVQEQPDSASSSTSAAADAAARSLFEDPSRRKMMLRAEDSVLKNMLKMMEACNARGFVYGIVSERGDSMSGSSESLRTWWKDIVRFDRNAPSFIVSAPVAGSDAAALASSCIHDLRQLQDSTLGSLLSALLQYCDPPQRTYPLDRGVPPPWWPTGDESWWGVQGEAQLHGPPPYRKPHDLKKAWKLSLLAAVIKHMSPKLGLMRALVWKSTKLQNKMTARESATWSKVVDHEEAILQQLAATSLDAPPPPEKRKCEFASNDEKEKCARDELFESFCNQASVDLPILPADDMIAIDRLIMQYSSAVGNSMDEVQLEDLIGGNALDTNKNKIDMNCNPFLLEEDHGEVVEEEQQNNLPDHEDNSNWSFLLS